MDQVGPKRVNPFSPALRVKNMMMALERKLKGCTLFRLDCTSLSPKVVEEELFLIPLLSHGESRTFIVFYAPHARTDDVGCVCEPSVAVAEEKKRINVRDSGRTGDKDAAHSNSLGRRLPQL